MTRLRIATFNIRTRLGWDGSNRWSCRRHITEQVIRDLDADVWAFQEVRRSQLCWLEGRLGTTYFFEGVGRNDGVKRGEHLVVAFRRNMFELVSSEPKWFTSTPSRPGRHQQSARNRFILTTTVDVEGSRLRVACTHLDEKSDMARRDACEMIPTLVGPNTVLLGDFNCLVDDPAMDFLYGSGYVDALSALPPEGDGVATHHEFTGTRDGSRIDHILVPANMTFEGGAIYQSNPEGPWASDHWPVFATLII